MRTRHTLAGLATLALGVGALAGASPASAGTAESDDVAPAAAVSLDFLRGVETNDVGHDEVFIQTSNGQKIWPLNTAYVSIGGDGDVADVNRLAQEGDTIELWDVDDVDGNDHLGSIYLTPGGASGTYQFRGSGAVYDLDIDY